MRLLSGMTAPSMTALRERNLPLPALSCAVAVRSQDAHNWQILSRIGWPTFAWRRRLPKLLLLWDLLHRQGPPQLVNRLPRTVPEHSSYCHRNKLSIALPFCHTSHRLYSFLPASIALFNSLPSSLTSCSSRSTFLIALDQHFSSDRFRFGIL